MDASEPEALPPSRSQTPDGATGGGLSTRHAFVLLVSIQVGSGIFSSSSQVDSNAPSPGAALLIWLIAGIVGWTGATSFAELGAALPGSGGMQEYLRYTYGDMAAFLMAWTWIVAVKPSAMAIMSIILVESLDTAINLRPSSMTSTLKLYAMLALVPLVLLNTISTKTSARLGEFFFFSKLITVLIIVIAGLSVVLVHASNLKTSTPYGGGDWYSHNWFQPRPTTIDGNVIDWLDISWWRLLGFYSTSFYGALWAYTGWDNANFISSEMRDPGSQLPVAIHSAMMVVMICFGVVNISYYIVLPWEAVATNDAVAVAAATSLFGYAAGIFIALLVAISCAGALNGNVFVVGRLTVAASKRGYLPSVFSRMGLPHFHSPEGFGPLRKYLERWKSRLWHTRNNGRDDRQYGWVPILENEEDDQVSEGDIGSIPARIPEKPEGRWNTPINAMLLNTTLTCIYISLGSFRELLTFAGMAEYTFILLTVIGLILLRTREPSLPRPYKPPIIIPIIFCLVIGAILIRTAIFLPVQGFIIALLVAGGLGVHLYR